jgi:alkanesulfonate monooxygenase
MNLRFHWMLPKGGEVDVNRTQTAQAAAAYRIASTGANSPAPRPDMPGWTHFGEHAERAGIESVLISFSRYEPDPFMVACALGQATKGLKFIAAYRSGLMQPTTFVQQLNSVSAITEGRLALNIVAGSSSAEQRGYGDYLPHDERYARAEEFLAVCNAFWQAKGDVDFDGRYYQIQAGKLATPFLGQNRLVPEIYVSGHSESAERLARTQGSCLLRVADSPDKLQEPVARVRKDGVEVCLRICVLCRPTREEAISVAESLIPELANTKHERSIAVKDDSQMYREAAALPSQGSHWLTRSLWTGLVPHYGPVWTTLLGTPRDIAEAFLEYKNIGVTQFIMSGWPELDELVTFGQDVLPLVREAERQQTESRRFKQFKILR